MTYVERARRGAADNGVRATRTIHDTKELVMPTSQEYIVRAVKEVTESSAPDDVKAAAIKSIRAGNEYAVWRKAHLTKERA